MSHIRNFSIIAHIDHGKSTLADRMLEITNTVPARKMKEQVLDSMDLERERGITIKMQPVRMEYLFESERYELNLIDTPGHIDFSYEVSRALKAVEGCILLIDSTQGVQAQTLSVLRMAQEQGLVIVPAVSKVDSPLARIREVKVEVARLLSCSVTDILEVSGRTGLGIPDLIKKIIEKVPPPSKTHSNFQSLVFDFKYSNHRGVVVFVRIIDGSVSKGDSLVFKVAGTSFVAGEIGVFTPGETPIENLSAGEIGYIVTGVKEPGVASVGDTITSKNDSRPPLPGYQAVRPIVWASIYPESQDDFDLLKQALLKLRLSDSSLSFEEETSGAMGRGFRCGFLGMLHLEIISERLKREFDLKLVTTSPSVTYEVSMKDSKDIIVYSPAFFPDQHLISSIKEPFVDVSIIAPTEYIGSIMQIFHQHEAAIGQSQSFSDNRIEIKAQMPLRELMRGFFEKVKSASSGFASVAYEVIPSREADVVRMDVLIADEPVLTLSRIVSRRTLNEEAEKTVERLYGILPKQLFVTKIQAVGQGRIIASRTLSAMRKDVTGYLYGGDITRKRKLWEKQKRGKKKMKERGTVKIPHEVFIKMIQP
ncbi:MAG: elongation factor 4 [Candidatus Zambryskibacteria bacterium RIFCSPLOWO2_01_FULL_45_21]|uniref:Elongation factor 4 n=1 Tax=Candidatus Zambryskibacteria bacterium RIFCSPLOWO2_01_FULL_45_21 TaxID=1802761 RepID=A0A1G2U5L8_9BACT|nr:MAG: elongation factor 4 [Candidatus Zambryskibacteria bacterium RIFCSPLOWO2_01_FULL_45_21]